MRVARRASDSDSISIAESVGSTALSTANGRGHATGTEHSGITADHRAFAGSESRYDHGRRLRAARSIGERDRRRHRDCGLGIRRKWLHPRQRDEAGGHQRIERERVVRTNRVQLSS